MSPEIDLLNTYEVCGQERADRFYHLETATDWQGREVTVPVYDVPVDVRVAAAMVRVARERRARSAFLEERP